MATMNQAASSQNFLLRVQDLRAVLDQLKAWNKEQGTSPAQYSVSPQVRSFHTITIAIHRAWGRSRSARPCNRDILLRRLCQIEIRSTIFRVTRR